MNATTSNTSGPASGPLNTPASGPLNTPASGPLGDLVVLDFTLALAGPFATLLLAGLGARVIKVEAPGGATDPARRNAPFVGPDGVSLERRTEDDISIAMMERARGKEAITLDLKHPEAAAVIADLARHSDLAVQNWSPGVAERLGVDHRTLAQHNPAIVTSSITGFGLGPEGNGRKAMDTIIQAMSGLMMTGGHPDDPPIMNGVPLADLGTPLFAVIGALAAVHHARRTGEGQLVDVSMLGAMTSLVATEPFAAYEQLGLPLRPGNTVQRLAPFGHFPTANGHVALCAPTDNFSTALLTCIGGPELADDPRFATRPDRVGNHHELHAMIGDWMTSRTTEEVLAALDTAGVPAAAVRSPVEAVADPSVAARGEVEPLRHPTAGPIDGLIGSGVPIVFSRSTTGHHRPAPEVGAHNQSVYGDLLGYSGERLAELAELGVI